MLLLQISPDGIICRDEKVFRFAREKNIPLVMLTSGILRIRFKKLFSVLRRFVHIYVSDVFYTPFRFPVFSFMLCSPHIGILIPGLIWTLPKMRKWLRLAGNHFWILMFLPLSYVNDLDYKPRILFT